MPVFSLSVDSYSVGMSDNKADTVALFKKLSIAVNSDDSKSILDSCNAILQVLPDDVDAQKCRIVCYIHMGKFDEAIKVIDKSAHDFSLERAYCFYLEQKFDAALEQLNKRGKEDADSNLLKAQILYRLEQYDESLKLYQKMTKSEDYAFLTNISAAYLLSSHLEEGAALLEKCDNTKSYEVLYNYGTILLYLGKLDEAGRALTQALHFGRQQLREGGELEVDVEEDSGDEPELDPIRVQLAYLKIMRGDRQGAEKELLSVLSHRGISKVVATIAICNLIACRGSQDSTDSLKRLKSFPSDVVLKLTPQQQSVFHFNRAMLLLLLNRKKEFTTALNDMEKSFPAIVAVLRACDMVMHSKDKEAVESLQEAIKRMPSRDLYLLLIQTLLNQKRYVDAISTITTCPPDLLHTPAIRSLFFALCRHVQDQKQIDSFIQSMSSPAATLSEVQQIDMLQAAAAFFFDTHQYDLASTQLRSLLEHPMLDSQRRIEVMSRLVLADSRCNEEEAIRLAAQLPDVGIVENVDMNELEELLHRREYLKHTTQSASSTMDVEESPVNVDNVKKMEAEKKRKLNRKMRARKTAKFIQKLKEAGKYREPQSLDPERWLPKEERTVNRRRKKNVVSITGVGAQGEHVSQAEMDKYDARKRKEHPEMVQKVVVDKALMRRKRGRKGRKYRVCK